MTAPRLEIDLNKIQHNACKLVELLADRGISVTGITKAASGSPEIANALLRAGVHRLGDSRIENIEAMRLACVSAPMVLIRSPMLSQVDRVVTYADISFNTELDVIRKLSSAAKDAGKTHGVVLMLELGDLREGIMPGDLEGIVRETLCLTNIALKGIGTNLACRNGVRPDDKNMGELSTLADVIDSTFGVTIDSVSGGNSGNLQWALGTADTGRINDLRLGESILLGRDPLHRRPVDGLYTDAITLVAEVIEVKTKPSRPWGEFGQAAFGEAPVVIDQGCISQTILAIGCQDTDPNGLRSMSGIEVIGASSDHLIVDAGHNALPVGAEVIFQPNYSALVRAFTSPFVGKVMKGGRARVPMLASHANH